MAKVRSPNYPTLPLGPALEAMRVAWTKDHRNKMSRAVLAKHLGYTSLNGRALAKIGAVRAYGLIEGSGDELRVSEIAVRALAAPPGSPERQTALNQMALRPSLFAEIRKQFPENHPSRENLVYWLVTQNFTQKAAEKAAQSYLSTMNLAAGVADSYNPGDEEDESEEGTDLAVKPPLAKSPLAAKPSVSKVNMERGERELTSGLLGKDTSFRLIVSGEIGVKEIERLIKKLEIDKEILAEKDEFDEILQ